MIFIIGLSEEILMDLLAVISRRPLSLSVQDSDRLLLMLIPSIIEIQRQEDNKISYSIALLMSSKTR